ncbi:hypothetical protein, partial [Peribacillus butanolivorans]|uniref:hypothetical protein n=1 Tax=Peribacillus butanolivorans TaxID=421767 RepID=UPI00364B7157
MSHRIWACEVFSIKLYIKATSVLLRTVATMLNRPFLKFYTLREFQPENVDLLYVKESTFFTSSYRT